MANKPIYIAHSREYDYEKELYQPVRSIAELDQTQIILPHETERHNTREFYRTLGLMIAEVSYPATGMGIELGWANDDKTPIICVYRQGTKPSGSLWAVTDRFYEYQDMAELKTLITKIIQEYNS